MTTKTVNIILYQSDIRPETRRDMLERIYQIYKIWNMHGRNIIDLIVPREWGPRPQPFINFELPTKASNLASDGYEPMPTDPIVGNRITFEYHRQTEGHEQIDCEGLIMWRRSVR